MYPLEIQYLMRIFYIHSEKKVTIFFNGVSFRTMKYQKFFLRQ